MKKEKLRTYIVKKGNLNGTLVEFPTTTKELRRKFRELGIAKDDWDIIAVETGDENFGTAVLHCRDLDELNYLGYWISQLDSVQYSLFFEFAAAGLANGSNLSDYINLAANLNSCYRVDGIQNELSLGKWRVAQYEKEVGHPISALWDAEDEDFEDLGYAFAANFHGRFFNGDYYARFSTWKDVYNGESELIPPRHCLTDPLRALKESHG